MTVDSLVQWLDLHRSLHFLVASGLIAAALVSVVGALLRHADDGGKRHDWIWGLVILAILFAGRWPSFLVTREINPDESQLLAGARALLNDPVYWRAVDAGSSGPLNFFVLWPAGWLLNWNGYLPSRLTALGLLAITFTLAHQCVALIAGRRVARAVILGAVCLEALTNTLDFLFYSTELLPLALLTGAVYAGIRRWRDDGGPGWNALGGLLLGAVPLTKLQGIPLAACLGLCWLVAEMRVSGPRSRQRRFQLVGYALLPVASFAMQITLAGEWRNVIIPYITYNLQYTAKATLSAREQLTSTLGYSLAQDSLLHLWLGGMAVWGVAMIRWRRSAERATRIFVLATVLGAPLAVWSAMYPGRPFLHYWQFIVVPGVLLVGALAANLLSAPPTPWARSRRAVVIAGTVLVVGLLLGQRARHPDDLFGSYVYFRKTPHTELSIHVAAQAKPGDTVAIWGWSSYVYVETGLVQATRDAHFERAIETGRYQEYFRARFLADLLHAQPALFVDSVGPSSLHYWNRRFAHDRNYPDLAAVIRADYVLVDEVDEARIYRRKAPARP